jgi:hypothetical protein
VEAQNLFILSRKNAPLMKEAVRIADELKAEQEKILEGEM